MKKYLFLTALCCLLGSAAFAQEPKDPRGQLTNYFIARSGFVEIDIPVYLPTYLNLSPNANIKFCWYPTKIAFGDKVRTSEDPIRIEEGNYANGRLTMYHKNNRFYKFDWAHNGVLNSITEYDQNGDFISRQRLPSSYKWYDANSIIIRGNLSWNTTDPIFVTSYEIYKTGGGHIEGFTVKDDYIIELYYWKYRSGEVIIDKINRLHISQIWGKGKNYFNFNDPIGYTYFEY